MLYMKSSQYMNLIGEWSIESFSEPKGQKEVIIKELEDTEVSNHLFNKKTFKELLKTGKSKKFYRKFTEGMKNYIGGDWAISGKLFNDCIKLVSNDKPTKVLLDYLKEHNYKSPPDWKGFRSLTSK